MKLLIDGKEIATIIESEPIKFVHETGELNPYRDIIIQQEVQAAVDRICEKVDIDNDLPLTIKFTIEKVE